VGGGGGGGGGGGRMRSKAYRQGPMSELYN
jgi:hypothetical protein